MAGTLAQFTAEIRKRNVSRPTLFYVQLTAPTGNAGSNIDGPPSPSRSLDPESDRLIPFLCFSANTPSSNFLTQDNYVTAGTKRKFVYDHDYGTLRLEFYCDQNYQIKKYFDKWKNIILTDGRNFGYPKDYTVDALELFILNMNDKEVYQYTYRRVFPKTISEVNLSWLNGNQIATFSVEFNYEEVYFTEKNGDGSINESSYIESVEPISLQRISQNLNREIINNLQTQASNSPEVQGLLSAFDEGVNSAESFLSGINSSSLFP